MSDIQVLHSRVGDVRTRIRLLIAQRWTVRGLIGGVLFCLLLVAATKFQWWRDAEDYLWVAITAGGFAGFIYGWMQPVSRLDAAQIADERAGLKERLSTAVELSGAESRSEIADAQLADAAKHAEELRASAILPWRMPFEVRYLAAAIALLAAVMIVPNLDVFKSAQDKADQEAMKLQGEQIQAVAKKLQNQVKKGDDKNGEILRRVAQNMSQLGKDQKLGRVSKKQAMLQLNDLQKQLKEAQEKTGGGSSQKGLDKSIAEMKQAAQRQAQQGNGDASKALQQMAGNLEKRDLDAAKKQLEEMANKMRDGKMSPEDAKKLSDTLEQMAKSMSGTNLDQASKEMKDAAQQLQKAAQATQQLQKQMQQAKTPQEKQQLQQQMAQQMSQGLQQAAQQTAKAGGT